MPSIRLDFILYSFPSDYKFEIISAGVINNTKTSFVSDHYPVHLTWKDTMSDTCDDWHVGRD